MLSMTYIHGVDLSLHYLRRYLASGEGIVTLGVTLSRSVCVRRISRGGEGDTPKPVL